MIRNVLGTTVNVVLLNWLLIFLETWVHLDLTWLHMRQFPVLPDVGWGAIVAGSLQGEDIRSQAVV